MRFDRLPHHATARWLVPLLVLLGVQAPGARVRCRSRAKGHRRQHGHVPRRLESRLVCRLHEL